MTVVASGIPYANGVTFNSSGQFFVASGGGQAVYEVSDGVASIFAGSGLSYPSSIATLGNDLYVSNSGNGTISGIDPAGDVEQILGGLSAPNGPFGISFDASGTTHFIDHATGGVYSYSEGGSPQLLYTVTSLGGTFTATGFGGQLFATDVNLGELLMLAGNGDATVFASGFAGKGNPPFIGPSGIAYNIQDASCNLVRGLGTRRWSFLGPTRSLTHGHVQNRRPSAARLRVEVHQVVHGVGHFG